MKVGKRAKKSQLAGKLSGNKMKPPKMAFTNPGPTKALRGIEPNTARKGR